jgi:5-methylcytosine-specific restriction endonuclease McrA
MKRKRTRKPVTPPSRIRSVLRRAIWLYSRERAEALKRDGRRCRACGSKEKLEVHHLDGSGIDAIIELIYKTLLCSPDRLVCLCRACHLAQEPHETVKSTEASTAPEAIQSTISKKTTRGMGRD